jgi:hypothetical protein
MLKATLTLLVSVKILTTLCSQATQFQGAVFDFETKKPIEFVSVSVLGTDSSLILGTVTDGQ